MTSKKPPLPPQADEKLPTAEHSLLELVIETAPDGLIIIDEQGGVRAFNPAAERMFGYKADEIIGRNVSILMPSAEAERHDDYLQRYLATGKRHIIGIGREVMACRKNGDPFPVELAVGELMIGGRHLFTGFVRDLTEHRLSEKQIARLQDKLVHVARHSAMGELSTTLSHEINQPLTAIANYLLVIEQQITGMDKSCDKEALLQLVDKASTQAQRAGETLRSVRTFIRHHENSLDWEDLEESVREAVKIATIGATRKQIQVKVSAPDELPLVCMDRVQIQQVVANLVRNAVDALENHEGARRIQVEMEPHGRRSVIVRVIDNGPGIAREVLKRLFESFNTSKPHGVGIGLAISKRIIASHKGSIRGRNLPDGGAEFQIVLPIDARAEEM